MAGGAAVGVDDDLASGEAGVTDGSADHEDAGRVDQQALVEGVFVEELAVSLGQDGRDHVLPEVGADLRLVVDALGVLGGDQDLLDRDRLAVGVADGDLGLAVGTEVVEDAFFADQ